jgi:hypothetical protein
VLLSDQWVSEEIKKETKKCVETNKMETKHTKASGTQQKLRAGGVPPSKHEALSSNPSTTKKSSTNRCLSQ